MLDEEAERSNGIVVRNTMRLGPLKRKDLGATFLCQAFNSDQVGPQSTEVKLDMYRECLMLGITLVYMCWFLISFFPFFTVFSLFIDGGSICRFCPQLFFI